jgi:glucosamine--fructose-6-phosphate aminotransferase (isomerizing)
MFIDLHIINKTSKTSNRVVKVKKKTRDMCGIVGALATGRRAIGGGRGSELAKRIIYGLHMLKSRGYDSCGVGYLGEEAAERRMRILKYAGMDALDRIESEMMTTADAVVARGSSSITVVMGHTRWATHGNVTDANSHPHMDRDGRVMLVHNGIIENATEMKREAMAAGYVFCSETDSEVIAVYIGWFLDEGNSIQEAIVATLKRLSGTWALLIAHRDYPDRLWVTRNGSPLLIGMVDDDEEACVVVASEAAAFGRDIKKYTVMNNHDVLEIRHGSDVEVDGDDASTAGNEIRFQRLVGIGAREEDGGDKDNDNQSTLSFLHYHHHHPHHHDRISPEECGYRHWMMKEIMEQPEAIMRALNNGGRIADETHVKLGGLETCRTGLLSARHLILLGCGTSYHAGVWSTDLFKSLDLFDSVRAYDAGEFDIRDVTSLQRGVGSAVSPSAVAVIFLSQSGETKDLHRCISMFEDVNAVKIGVVNGVDSMIARETDCGVYLNAGREMAVASTKSFTNQCIVLSLIAVWFSQNRQTFEEKRRIILQDIHKLSYQMTQCLKMDDLLLLPPVCRFSSKKDNGDTDDKKTTSIYQNTMFLLGKGSMGLATAMEGALKLKEVACIHAEAYSASALKHGPLALIHDGTPVICIDLERKYHEKLRNASSEIRARGGYVMTFLDDANEQQQEDEGHVRIDTNSTFSTLLANTVIQRWSYQWALDRQLNPDFPRNLAKVVTVE